MLCVQIGYMALHKERRRSCRGQNNAAESAFLLIISYIVEDGTRLRAGRRNVGFKRTYTSKGPFAKRKFLMNSSDRFCPKTNRLQLCRLPTDIFRYPCCILNGFSSKPHFWHAHAKRRRRTPRQVGDGSLCVYDVPTRSLGSRKPTLAFIFRHIYDCFEAETYCVHLVSHHIGPQVKWFAV